MQAFTRLDALACPLPLTGVDTDQLIPARFMKRPRSEGYGPFLLHDLRADPAFPLNDPARAGAAILVARRNFGGGSSREAAVYALLDHGFRCVVAPSFGDIFAANAVGNGLLPAQAEEADVEAILAALESGQAGMQVDLESRRITCGSIVCGFAIDPVWRMKLLRGWDDLDITRNSQGAIDAFVAQDRPARPWAWR